MNLVIDLGNTLSKIALYNNDELVHLKKFHSNKPNNLIEYLKTLEYTSSIISSVIKTPIEMVDLIKTKVKSIIYFDRETQLPIINKYNSPETLGNDRLALSVGGYSKFPDSNVLIIDAGTCITYDLVNKKGEYLGGAISPGINVRFKSLGQFTHNLPTLELANIDYTLGSTTEESIRSGVINGVIFEIESFIKKINRSFAGLKVIFSGGDSIFLSKKLKNCTFVDSNFLLYGLNKILLFNAT